MCGFEGCYSRCGGDVCGNTSLVLSMRKSHSISVRCCHAHLTFPEAELLILTQLELSEGTQAWLTCARPAGMNLIFSPVYDSPGAADDAEVDIEAAQKDPDYKGLGGSGTPYHVRVLIPCYKEPYEIVARTVAAIRDAVLPAGKPLILAPAQCLGSAKPALLPWRLSVHMGCCRE